MEWAALAQAGAQYGSDWGANLASINQARINRQWQLNMASTAYQRTMADMKAAGLNPLLAAGNGPTPSGGGSAATLHGGSGGSVGVSAERIARIDEKRVKNETDLKDQSIINSQRENELKDSQIATQVATAAKLNAEIPGARAVSEFTALMGDEAVKFVKAVRAWINDPKTKHGLGDWLADAEAEGDANAKAVYNGVKDSVKGGWNALKSKLDAAGEYLKNKYKSWMDNSARSGSTAEDVGSSQAP